MTDDEIAKQIEMAADAAFNLAFEALIKRGYKMTQTPDGIFFIKQIPGTDRLAVIIMPDLQLKLMHPQPLPETPHKFHA